MAAKQAVHERNRAGHNATNVMRELESRMAGVARAAFHPARTHRHTLLVVRTIHAYTPMVVYTRTHARTHTRTNARTHHVSDLTHLIHLLCFIPRIPTTRGASITKNHACVRHTPHHSF